MSREKPLSVEDVLAAEREALRPESDGPLSALCVSGGGIRSATFGLGVLQGLAERGLLSRFDYLSTVSGGGYIGSWLTAWVQRAGGIEGVEPHLSRDAPPPDEGAPRPISHLREYNNYLSPKLGLLSFDTWSLIATVGRNILLNWMVFIPLLMAMLMVPRLYLSVLAAPEVMFGDLIFASGTPDYTLTQLDVIGGSPWVAFGLPALVVVFFAVALFNTLRYMPGVGNHAHTGVEYLSKVLAPLVIAALALLAHDALHYVGSFYQDTNPAWPLVLGTLAVTIAALIAFFLFGAQGSLSRRADLVVGPLTLGMAFMAAGTGLASWLALNFILWSPDPSKDLSWSAYVTAGPPSILIGFALGTVLFMGLASRRLTDEDREWMSRSSAGVLLFCLGWTALAGAVLVAPRWLLSGELWDAAALVVAAAAGAGATIFGGAAAAGAGGRLRKTMGSLVAKMGPALFIVSVVVGLSILTNIVLVATGPLLGMEILNDSGNAVVWQDHAGVLERSHTLHLVLVTLSMVALSWVMAQFVDINTFSLHGMYRDRLVRAYLGASNSRRDASGFTDFAPNDDLAMRELDPSLKPFHVVNLTLNLTSGDRLAWQQRKAQSFTVSPLHCGAGGLGYRPSDRYGGRHGISLGTALAISGAAASPSMGYHSSAVVGFIMTLFNARLGSWLGNPGAAGDRSWTHASPRSVIRSMLREAFGMTSNRGAYAYFSDGGHFENLALYEMVRRRCRTVVLLDSGCDPDFAFADLGNALRKIRIDHGIPIEFDEAQFDRLRERAARCALATIRYSVADPDCEDGQLVYIKPMFRGNEPPDVVSYHAANPVFPHQPTSDQWFDESQTESYRMLGLATVDEMCAGWDGGPLASFHDHLATHYLHSRPHEHASPEV